MVLKSNVCVFLQVWMNVGEINSPISVYLLIFSLKSCCPVSLNQTSWIQTRQNESCVVWTHLNSTNREIVEIGLDGEAKFWNNRLERIKTFPKLPESELLDFSIQIRNVQQSDLGVYHCTLFRETGCLLFYKRIELHNGKREYCWLKSQCASIAWNAALIKKFYFHCLERQITIRADVGLIHAHVLSGLYFISQDRKIRCEKTCKTWWQYGKICTVAIKFIQRL